MNKLIYSIGILLAVQTPYLVCGNGDPTVRRKIAQPTIRHRGAGAIRIVFANPANGGHGVRIQANRQPHNIGNLANLYLG